MLSRKCHANGGKRWQKYGKRQQRKEKAGCGNLPQLAEFVRLATPLARFGKIDRTASKQGVASSSLAGRATSLETHSIQRSNRDHSSPVASPPIICFFDRWSETAGLSRFSFFFCRSNCLRELNPIRYPLRIRSCHRNVIHAEHDKRVPRPFVDSEQRKLLNCHCFGESLSCSTSQPSNFFWNFLDIQTSM